MSSRQCVFESDAIKAAIPRDFSVDNTPGQRQMMERLLNYQPSPFYKKNMADVFLYSMALAFRRGLEPLVLKKRAASIPATSIGDKGLSLLLCIAVAEKGPEVLEKSEDIKDFVTHAEELANRGLEELYEMVLGEDPGDPDRIMERDLREVLAQKSS